MNAGRADSKYLEITFQLLADDCEHIPILKIEEGKGGHGEKSIRAPSPSAIIAARMRTCPACKASVLDNASRCSSCEATLVDSIRHADSLSDTVRSSTVAALKPLLTPTQAEMLVGTRLAERYEINRKIGEGGMGAVYEATHLLIGKRVAIKVLLDKYAQKADVVARLQQEARLASSIGHENIVDITDFGSTEDGRTFVVMEFLEGISLAQRLANEGPLEPLAAIGIARQVTSALGAAHGKDIVHRDVKPENVFLIQRGERDFVKVVDFGISKLLRPANEDEDSALSSRLTHTGMVLGTPLYMSPEQARGEEMLDHRIDVYAVGVILYEMVTGEVPFRGSNYLSVISQVLSSEPRPPRELRPDLGISAALEDVILKAMRKDRGRRYQTMQELDADLARLEAGVSVNVSSPRLSRAGIRRGRPVRLMYWAVAGAVILIGAAGAVTLLVPDEFRNVQGVNNAQVLPILPPPAPGQALAMNARVETITVHVKSEPPGANIWWQSVHQGHTPQDIELPKGSDQIELSIRSEGFEDARASFYPFKDQTILVTLKKAVLPAKSVRTSAKSGAKVLTRQAGKDTGPTAGGDLEPTPYQKK